VLIGLGLLALLLALSRSLLVPYRIIGDSMLPTLVGGSRERRGGVRGDVVLVSRSPYWWGRPRRWDVVVVERDPGTAGAGEESASDFVKRVVGLPEETVEIRDGRLLIQGEAVELPAALQGVGLVRKGKFGLMKVALKKDEYFVLGDNSYPSRDSRQWGPVRRSLIQGRVLMVIHPWKRLQVVR
jgi:signal peptidase I